MAESKFDKVWDILSNYNLEINGDVSDDLLCSMCRKIMINSYSASCGCHYCYRCVEGYIGNEHKYCPGNREECREEYLVMEVNVLKDLGTRRKIANLVVTCPNKACLYKTKLENMEQHIRICVVKPIECPFEMIGCNNEGVREDSMVNHLHLDALMHSRLLIDAINNMRSDVEQLKRVRDKEERRVVKIRREITVLRGVIGEQRSEEERRKICVEEQREEINKLREEGEKNKAEMEDMRRRIGRLEEEGSVMRREMEEFCQERREREMIISSMREELTDMRMAMLGGQHIKKECSIGIIKEGCGTGMIKEEWRDREARMKTELDGVIGTINIVKETVRRMTVMTLCVSNTFVYTIHDVSKKNGWRDSETFFKDNYKLCLRILIGQCYLRSHLCIMQGDKDDRLEWPMRHTVTITILNEETMTEYASNTCNYDTYNGDQDVFRRPQGPGHNEISGPHVYLKDNHIRASLFNDSITICCLLMPSN